MMFVSISFILNLLFNRANISCEISQVYNLKGFPITILFNDYAKILDSIRNKPYHTINPDEACLFVPSLDTLDRDELSPAYVQNLQSKFSRRSISYPRLP